MGVSCDPVGLQSVTLYPHTVSISQPAEAPSACVVCWRICSSISILNDCLTAPSPPPLAASSTTFCLVPSLPCRPIFSKIQFSNYPRCHSFCTRSQAGEGPPLKRLSCAALRASVYFQLPGRRSDAEAQRFIHHHSGEEGE